MMVDLHMRFHVIAFSSIRLYQQAQMLFFFTFFSLYIIAEKAHLKCVEFSVVLSLDHLSGANLVCHVRRLSNEQLIMC